MRVLEQYSLRDRNTFMLDAKADVFAEYDSVGELRELLRRYASMPLLHIGQGSNLLFTGDFHGLVLHSNIRYLSVLDETDSDVTLEAGSGVVFDDFVQYAVDNGWYGAENLSYIPGEVGSSAVQNIGAYGVEVKDIIVLVRALEIASGEERVFDVSECRYGYRDSVFKHELRDWYIITAVVFRLSKLPVLQLDYGNVRASLSGVLSPSASDVRSAIIGIRREKLPEVGEVGSAGSFFKNPVVSVVKFESLREQYADIPHFMVDGGVKIPAAWLISESGMRGACVGGAAVYDKQPLVIVNRGGATASDVVALADRVRGAVAEKFGIVISPEVIYV